MTSRLTAFAALFAIVSTATLAFAANSATSPSSVAKPQVRYVQLERVEVIAHRSTTAPN